MQMQREMASIPKVGLVIRSLDLSKREKSEISGRDLQKSFEEFKTVNSILLTKYCSHRTEISTKDVVTHILSVIPNEEHRDGLVRRPLIQ
jgi:hypothetical protein